MDKSSGHTIDGTDLYRRARTIIPGGTQLLSKRPEMFYPGGWPAYYSDAKGAIIRDLNGREYLDFTHCGVGSCVMGYAYGPVNEVVKNAVDRGSMSTLNCPEEVEVSQALLDRHEWADQVRLARTGGESMAVAVRIARAATGRDRIAFCGYHGWHDWYIAANLSSGDSLEGHLLPGLSPKGVPSSLQGTAVPFEFNNPSALRTLFDEHGDELAAVVMEPVRNTEPKQGFLETVRELTRKHRSVLVFDEITSGWRIRPGGAHLAYGVNPDVAVFAKAISNGFPMGSVVGKQSVMEHAQNTFISSTYWTERLGPVAALKTLEEYDRKNVHEHLVATGCRVKEIWKQAGKENGLTLRVEGLDPLAHFEFEEDSPRVLQTLFTQEMLTSGFLASDQFYPMWSHEEAYLERYERAVMECFATVKEARDSGAPEERLDGDPAQAGFEWLN